MIGAFEEINCQVQWVHLRSSASVAGNDVNRLYERRLGQFPGEGVLAATIANEEDAQLVVRHCERGEVEEELQRE